MTSKDSLMINKERLFVVASNVDDSIKSATTVYDITIFKTWIALEEYLNKTPIVLGGIIISEKELPFNNLSMSRLLDLMATSFLKLRGNVIYLIGPDTNLDMVQSFILDNDIRNLAVYQGDLSSRYITDIVSGAGRDSDEEQLEVVTYRMRASDYALSQGVKRYESDDAHYETDEEELSGIPDVDEPDIILPSYEEFSEVYYIVGECGLHRSLFAFIEAQYLSLGGKTLLMESDTDYHYLTDIARKSGVDIEYIDIDELLSDISSTLTRIRLTMKPLILIGCVNRTKYSYVTLFSILKSNLKENVNYFIQECDFSMTPYGNYYTVVSETTVPALLRCGQSIMYKVEPKRVNFVGININTLDDYNVTTQEMQLLLSTILLEDKINAQVLCCSGTNLIGGEETYDILSLINRGNPI